MVGNRHVVAHDSDWFGNEEMMILILMMMMMKYDATMTQHTWLTISHYLLLHGCIADRPKAPHIVSINPIKHHNMCATVVETVPSCSTHTARTHSTRTLGMVGRISCAASKLSLSTSVLYSTSCSRSV